MYLMKKTQLPFVYAAGTDENLTRPGDGNQALYTLQVSVIYYSHELYAMLVDCCTGQL